MVESDFSRFIGVWDNLLIAYGKQANQPDSFYKIMFTVLSDYSIDQIEFAAIKHMKNPDNGQFMPKPADIVKILDGATLTTDQVLCEARARETPFGVMAAASIGSWNLNNLSERDLKPYALEVLRKVDDWKVLHGDGEYSDHQMLTMIKHGVKPNQPFMTGMMPPKNIYQLREQYSRVKNSKAYLEISERIESDRRSQMPSNPEGVKKIKLMLSDMSEGDANA
jgi:hypothetical protein